MKDRDILYLFGAIIFALICLAIMVMMHEKHYQQRRNIIDPTKGIEDRIMAIEKILTEDRYT